MTVHLTARKPLSQRSQLFKDLDALHGLTNRQLLERKCVRKLFRIEANKYRHRDDPDDLVQRGYILWLSWAAVSRPEFSGDRFGNYLGVAVRRCIHSAYKYRHRKRRYFSARQFPVDRNNETIEPQCESAVVTFCSEERTQLRASVWLRATGNKETLIEILDAIMDGHSAKEVANKFQLSKGQFDSRRQRLKEIMQDAVDVAAGKTVDRPSTDRSGHTRMRQLKRVVTVANVINRYPRISMEGLRRRIGSFGFTPSPRTLRRDIDALIDLGFVQSSISKSNSGQHSVFEFSGQQEWPFR